MAKQRGQVERVPWLLMKTSERQTLPKMLAEHPFLNGLEPAHLEFIAGCASVEHIAPEEHILIEGQQADNFYLVHEGEVVLKTFLSPSEGFAEIQHIMNGDILGWSWLVPPHQWHFSAFATKPTTLIVINGQQLREQCEKDRDFGYEIQKRLMLVIGQRLRMTRKHLR